MTVRRLLHALVAEWPALAWLARCRPGEDAVRVLHGPRVEATDAWVCEAAWAGDYASGDFDGTDIVAGTGVRLRDGHVTFVSSGSTVDRLHATYADGALWVSNSLACLTNTVESEVDPTYGDYYWDFRSVTRGIRQYKRALATADEPIQLVYFDNLRWDGWTLRAVEKPSAPASFATFADFRGFLASSMSALGANLRDAARARPFSMLGTASTGYDSPTVTVLGAEAGLDSVLSFDRSQGRSGEPDSGAGIAQALGLKTLTVSRDAWRAHPLAEVPFIAADAFGEEVHYRSAEAHLEQRVLLTGYHGDKVWAKETKDHFGEIVRGDPSGLALTEYRLGVGFLHCAVPFWGSRRVPEIVALSNAAEMAPWDVPGDYSRPICRRIVEQAGIDRGAFGISKHAASVILHNEAGFMGEESMERFLHWLVEQRREWTRQRRVPPVASRQLDDAIAVLSLVVGARQLRPLRAFPPYGWLETRLTRWRSGPTYLRRLTFPWALSEAKAAYGSGGRAWAAGAFAGL